MSEGAILAICAALPPTLTAIAGIIIALKTRTELAETKKRLNGRLSQLIKAQTLLAAQRGHELGLKEQLKAPTPKRRRKPPEGG